MTRDDLVKAAMHYGQEIYILEGHNYFDGEGGTPNVSMHIDKVPVATACNGYEDAFNEMQHRAPKINANRLAKIERLKTELAFAQAQLPKLAPGESDPRD
jgi:hypothetical protein